MLGDDYSLMRAFSPAFLAEIAKGRNDSTRPFYTVTMEFAGGTLHFSDSNGRTSVDGDTHVPLVLDWGELGNFGWPQDPFRFNGATLRIKFANNKALVGGTVRLSDLFNWRLEGTRSTFYLNVERKSDLSVFREVQLTALAHAPDADFFEDEVTIQFTSLALLKLEKSLLTAVTEDDYPDAPDRSLGRYIPYPIGESGFVPALRLDDTNRKLTVAASPANAPVSTIGDIAWGEHTISENDLFIDYDPDASDNFNLSLLSARSIGNSAERGSAFSSTADTYLLGLSSGTLIWATISEIFLAPSFSSPLSDDSLAVESAAAVSVRSILIGVEKNASPAPLFVGLAATLEEAMVFDPFPPSQAKLLASTVIDPAGIRTLGAGTTVSNRADFHGFEMLVGVPYYLIVAIDAKNSSDTDYYRIHRRSGAGGRSWDWVIGSGWVLRDRALNLTIDYVRKESLSEASAIDPSSEEASTEAVFFTQKIPVGTAVPIRSIGIGLRRITGDLTGAVTAEIVRLDANEREIEALGSARFHAAEFTGVLTTAYQKLYKDLETVILLTPGNYAVRLTGELDETTRTFIGWQIRGIGTWTSYALPAGTELASFAGFNAPSKLSDTSSDPVALDITLRAVDWTRNPTGTDPAGRPSATLTADIDLPEDAEISAELVTAFRRPNDRVEVLLNAAGYADSDIDLAGSFAVAAAEYVSRGFNLDGAFTEQLSYLEAIMACCRNCRSAFEWSDKAKLYFLPDSGGTPVRVIKRNDVYDADGRPAILNRRSPRQEVKNLIVASYLRDLRFSDDRAYAKTLRRKHAASITVLGEKILEWPLNLTRTQAQAASNAEFLRDWFGIPKRLRLLETPLDQLPLEPIDKVGLSLDLVPSAGGGGFGEGGFGEGGFGGSAAGLQAATRRYGMINMGSPWRGILPFPTGAIDDRGDRQMVMFLAATGGADVSPAPVVLIAETGLDLTGRAVRILTREF